MTLETRTSHGITKTVLLWQGRFQTLDLHVEEVHGRVHFRRAVDRRHITTDTLTTAEAKHYAQCVLEAVQRAEAEQAGAA